MSLQDAFRLHSAGRLAEAEALYRQVLGVEPGNVHALHFLGVLRAQLGDMEGSLGLVGRAVKLNPKDALAQFHLGEAQRQLDRLEEAAVCYRRCLALKPDFAEALGALAEVLAGLGDWEGVRTASEKALALKPDCFETELLRARALGEVQRSDAALAAFTQVAARHPREAQAQNGRGGELVKLGRPAEALQAFDQAAALDPRSVPIMNNRASTLAELDRSEEALAVFQQALAAEPHSAITYYNLGSTLLTLQHWQAALAAFDSAITLNPDYAQAYHNRSKAFWHLGRKPECFRDCARALALNPDLGLAATRLFADKAERCDWQDRAQDVAELKRFCATDKRVDPFALLGAFDDPALHLKAARLAAGPARPPLLRKAAAPHRRLRLAYLSPDFRDHPVGLQLVEVLERHDRARFELFGVSLQAEAGSPIRRRLKAAFEHFDDAELRSDCGLAQLLMDWEIDIAVDLGGYTDHGRTTALASRPAPLAVSYLGYPGTTGAPYIDYLLADAVTIPPECERYYSEKIVRLPHCFFPADTTGRDGACPPTRAAEGLPEQGFVFCSFNNAAKFTPQLFDLWMRLLAAVAGSVLWLRLGKPETRDNLKREAQQRGIAPGRLIFAERAERASHLARIALADLFLDSTPYGAHTTANDALWSGLPVLTCPGQSFASRAAASQLTAAGLPQLIVTDLKAYEELALALARNPAGLAPLRNKLSRCRENSPLFDMKGLTCALEAAYQTIWEGHREGRKPQSFSVNMGS